jgi:hypothetical protein
VNNAGYSEVQQSLLPWVFAAAFVVVLGLTVALFVQLLRRPRPLGLAFAIRLIANAAVLGLIGWFLLAPVMVAHPTLSNTEVTCLDPLSAASLHGVPDDSTMSEVDVRCRAQSRTRLVVLGLGLMVAGTANGASLRKSRQRQRQRN